MPGGGRGWPLALAAAAWMLLAGLPCAAGSEASGRAPGDRRVEAIELRSAVPLRDAQEVHELLAFEVGDELTEAAVRRTLRNLRASGVAESAAVYRRPGESAGAVVAVVVIDTAYRVDEVKIEGELGIFSRPELLRSIPQRSGDPLVSDRVVRGVFRLQDRYSDAGYLRRSVRVVPRIDEATRRAVVTYQIDAGQRARIADIRFAGELAGFTREQLLEALRLGPDEPYARRGVDEAAERLQTWLVTRQKRRAARVDDPQIEVDAEAGTVELTYPIRVGPLVAVEVEGYEISKLRKAGLLPILGDDGYDEALVLTTVEAIRSYLQGRGHYRAVVTTREESSEDRLTVIFEVDPGPVLSLDEVLLEGNREVPDGTLSALMATGERSLLQLGSGRLVDGVLAADLDNLRSYYALSGFSGAEVGPARVEPIGGEDSGSLRLRVPIVEGDREEVASLAFEGIASLAVDKLVAELPLAAGGAYHPYLLDRALEVIRARYAEQGFATARVSAGQEWSEPEPLRPGKAGASVRRVRLTFQVQEGPQTVLDRVIVRGNRKTDEAVIRRAAAVSTGEPLSESLLLEVERRLFRLGIFSQADAELTPAPLGATRRDLLIRVEEGRTQRVTYGFGYDTELGAGGLFGYSHSNLLGQGLRFTVDAQVREERQQYRLFLEQPHLPRLGVPISYSLFRLERERESIVVNESGARVEVVKSQRRRRFALAYEYRNVESEVIAERTGGVQLPANGDPEPRREDSTLRISSLTPSFLIDRRNDPINPTRGWSSGAELEVAFPFPFAAEADFLKLQLQQTVYIPTGIDLGNGGWVIAANLRVGGIEPLDELDTRDPFIPDGLDLPSADIFVAERFFAGGRATHRAYDNDLLGVLGETLFLDSQGELVPAGGNGLLVVNVDLRFPIVDALGGTLFYDTGNVWADWRDIDPSEFRDGFGAGLRYLSPIGPLRFEVGWPVDRLPGHDTPVFHFSLGYNF